MKIWLHAKRFFIFQKNSIFSSNLMFLFWWFLWIMELKIEKFQKKQFPKIPDASQTIDQHLIFINFLHCQFQNKKDRKKIHIIRFIVSFWVIATCWNLKCWLVGFPMIFWDLLRFEIVLVVLSNFYWRLMKSEIGIVPGASIWIDFFWNKNVPGVSI